MKILESVNADAQVLKDAAAQLRAAARLLDKTVGLKLDCAFAQAKLREAAICTRAARARIDGYIQG